MVFLLGVEHLEAICARLIAAGRPAETPVAVVRRGSWPDQQLVGGTLADIVEQVALVGLTAPSVTVVGRVADPAHRFAWHRGPLTGKSVLVTRAREQASALSALLRSFGAKVVEFPAIRIAPAENNDALDAALMDAQRFDWACFTSANAVAAIGDRLAAIGKDWSTFRGLRVAAIGPATARALSSLGVAVSYMPTQYLADAVAAGLPDAAGARILLARADIADQRLVAGLEARGARVEQFTAYKTLRSDEDAPALRARLTAGEIDVVTFTSSSTVRNLCQALGEGHATLLSRCLITCIGPVTAGTAREFGLSPTVVADEHTINGLARALREYLEHTPH
jgi:uroporphyrinogen III methyltransferase/synthase